MVDGGRQLHAGVARPHLEIFGMFLAPDRHLGGAGNDGRRMRYRMLMARQTLAGVHVEHRCRNAGMPMVRGLHGPVLSTSNESVTRVTVEAETTSKPSQSPALRATVHPV